MAFECERLAEASLAQNMKRYSPRIFADARECVFSSPITRHFVTKQSGFFPYTDIALLVET